MPTAYYADYEKEYYDVTVEDDVLHDYEWPEWAELTLVGRHGGVRDLRHYVETRRKREGEVRYLLTDGRAGYVQGQYGYKLAESWKDPIRGVITVGRTVLIGPDHIERGWPGEDVRRVTRQLLNEYTEWCFGEVYSIVVQDLRGNVVDSVSGVIGEEHARDLAAECFTQWNPTLKLPDELKYY